MRAFYNCYNLTSVTIPDGVTTIAPRAFANCTRLESVTIPDSIIHIAFGAFEYCTRLKDVYYAGSEDKWNEISDGFSNEGITDVTIHYNYVPEE